MIYFDHAAHTPVHTQLVECYPALVRQFSGNPEAAHQLGYALRQSMHELEERLLAALLPAALKVEHRCFFGHDGTELLNSAGLVCSGKVSWHTSFDHPAAECMLQRSFDAQYQFSFDQYGAITALPAEDAEPALIYLNWVQSEIGTLQDAAEIIKLCRKACPEAVILLDAVQASALYEYPSDAPLPDLMLVSGAKLGAPGGAALLAVGKHCSRFGKAMEKLRRNEHIISKADPLSAAMLTEAAEICVRSRTQNREKIAKVNDFLRSALSNYVLPNREKIKLTVPAEKSAVNILHFMLKGYQAGVLVRMFSKRNIMLSSGSACESESRDPSRVLSALKYSRSDAFSGLRISFAADNTISEAEQFLSTLAEITCDY